MVIPDFRHLCLLTALLFASNLVHAQIYKWVDENGQINYTQQPPSSGDAEVVKVPPPPPVDTEQAQQEIDQLIEQQETAEETQAETQQEADEAARQQAIFEENCRIAQQNYTQYENNPGRRVMDEDGNVTRLSEEERQQKLQELQEQIELYCA